MTRDEMMKSSCLPANRDSQSMDINDNVQNGFANVWIKFCNAWTESFDIGCKQLVWIRNSVVEVIHFVVSEIPKSYPIID